MLFNHFQKTSTATSTGVWQNNGPLFPSQDVTQTNHHTQHALGTLGHVPGHWWSPVPSHATHSPWARTFPLCPLPHRACLAPHCLLNSSPSSTQPQPISSHWMFQRLSAPQHFSSQDSWVPSCLLYRITFNHMSPEFQLSPALLLDSVYSPPPAP